MGRRVPLVIGGGNAAVDAARAAWRAGAMEVHLLYRRDAALMPALASEVEEARREGVQFHFLTLPVRLLGEGRVMGLVAQKTELAEPDADGRLCPMPVPGSEFTLEVDWVILTVGQTADFSFFGPGLAFDTATIFRLEAESVTLATQIPGVFAGGDLVTGPRDAVRPLPPVAGPPWPSTLPFKGSRDRRSCRLSPAAAPTSSWIPPASHPSPASPCPTSVWQRGRPTGLRSGTGFHRRLRPGRSRPLPRLRLLSVCQALHLSPALCPAVSLHGKRAGPLLQEQGTTDPLIPYSCHYCGLCQAVCPKDLHAGRPCLSAREVLVERGQGPLPPHKGIQNYVKWGASPTFTLSRPDPATGKAARVFFPGCSLAGHATEVVKAAYAHLRRRLPDTGIMLNCCGAPSYFMGETDVMLRIIRNVGAEMAKLGAREIIVACTHCHQTLTEFLPEFNTRTIYEVLNEVGLPEERPSRPPWTFNIQDACGARQAPEIHAAVRRLVADLGHDVEEMAHNRERSICCGSGGMVPTVAPELARKRMTEFRLSEATRDLVTYCAACRARLAKAGHPTLHVLDLPFNPAWQRTKTRRRPIT